MRLGSRRSRKAQGLASLAAAAAPPARSRAVSRGMFAPAPMAFAPLIVRWGAEASSDQLRRCTRCTKCVRQGATSQPRRASSHVRLVRCSRSSPKEFNTRADDPSADHSHGRIGRGCGVRTGNSKQNHTRGSAGFVQSSMTGEVQAQEVANLLAFGLRVVRVPYGVAVRPICTKRVFFDHFLTGTWGRRRRIEQGQKSEHRFLRRGDGRATVPGDTFLASKILQAN